MEAFLDEEEEKKEETTDDANSTDQTAEGDQGKSVGELKEEDLTDEGLIDLDTLYFPWLSLIWKRDFEIPWFSLIFPDAGHPV